MEVRSCIAFGRRGLGTPALFANSMHPQLSAYQLAIGKSPVISKRPYLEYQTPYAAMVSIRTTLLALAAAAAVSADYYIKPDSVSMSLRSEFLVPE